MARVQDLIGSLALFLIAAAYYLAAADILDTGLADEIGARGLPTVLAALLALLALLIFLRALVFSGGAKTTDDPDKEPEATPWRALGLLAIGALYIPASWAIGYVPAIFLLLVAVTLYEGARLSWRVFVIAGSGAAFFWLLFVALLGVAQPPGFLFE